ncbi:hypothetical protein SAPIO_CDS8492 [Scedosporium apiospermum]|uniref:Major facilitator superfamily (MFS) profile domain-containing protein n=1 Tax=Pseudallescheria apiosperma TaxID=563466 RepID=A0A084FZR7_PSEDA|nr:uncharacterized protein SAPIO_CDS8492 [Scedosporium apiospermum]KEZ40579.1 hypothetical protein SAPIO_CDS8492 [Scedosporium apiospermum]
MFSTLSSYIYYPALPLVSKDLGVSISLVNLTVTSYLVVAGIAPSFMGDLADSSGRRPAYMLMFALMLSANIGIAVQKTYAGLLALRMVQSAGSSDLALSLGPVIGGGIAESLGWRWIFWFLVIWQGSHFVTMLLFVPETQRKIVGNGRRFVDYTYKQTMLELEREDVVSSKESLEFPEFPLERARLRADFFYRLLRS